MRCFSRCYPHVLSAITDPTSPSPQPSYQRRALDVLSGTGGVSLALSAAFEQVVGLEPDRDLLQHAQQLRQFGHCVFAFSEEGGAAAVTAIAKAAASTVGDGGGAGWGRGGGWRFGWRSGK